MPILLEVAHGAFGRIDRQMGEVGPTEPLELRVQIAEIAPLQQRIVRMVDPRHDVLRTKGDLLGLGEEIVDIGVKRECADDLYRDLLLRNDLGRIEHIEFEAFGEFLVEDLNA